MTARSAASGPTRPALRFNCVTKTYQPPGPGSGTTALTEIDLRVAAGESLGVIGPNGAGKTTMLRLAAGTTAPTAGTIERPTRTCAVLELGSGVQPTLTGRENTRVLAALLGMRVTGLGRRWRDIEAFSGLGPSLDEPVAHYSSGMLARLHMAVAVHSDPELLLLDEVLSVGDLEFQQQCRSKVAELRLNGTTIVLVSHDLELVSGACERAVLISGGRIELDGPATAVIDRYLGLPARNQGATLSTQLENRIVPSGDDLVAKVQLPTQLDGRSLRIEIVVREHPTFRSVGQDFSAVFGICRLRVPTSPLVHLRIPTDDLPPGRFELRVTLEGHDCEDLAVGSETVEIVAPPGNFAVRLSAELQTFVTDEGSIERDVLDRDDHP